MAYDRIHYQGFYDDLGWGDVECIDVDEERSVVLSYARGAMPESAWRIIIKNWTERDVFWPVTYLRRNLSRAQALAELKVFAGSVAHPAEAEGS